LNVRRAWALIACALLAVAPQWVRADVASSKHNLSASGSGTVKAASETQICLFCHTPHNASPAAALWSRRSSTAVYIPYTSTTARGGMGQPNGSSMLCLSCHDGTIALGELINTTTPITMAGGVTTMPAGAGRLGTDLGDDHPVSFAYTAALATQRKNELVNPAALTGRVKLDSLGRMQCTSCHDAHDNSNGKFLVQSNVASGLCTACHAKPGWSAGSHATSSRTWNGVGTNPWPSAVGTTVAANACENCHQQHSAPGRKFLLHSAAEESVCYPCHNGNVATKNVEAEFTKVSRHGVASSTGVHDPTEPAVVSAMHVECADCHNPHASKPGVGLPAGALTAVRGVNISGAEVAAVTSEYEVCFRCHADSTTRTPAPLITRQIAQGNIRLKFLTTNASFHAVAGPGRATNVPSLIAPWTVSSILKCSDCHNNNAGPGAAGTGPNGPHGSTFRPLLERQYVTTDRTAYAVGNYAMCFKCHSSTSILSDNTFREHNKHITGSVRSPCSVCHDAHGAASPGTTTNNMSLINFDTSVVTPSSSGVLRFETQGAFRGRCYLSCHGVNHNPYSY
jgi:predicted CXXCH cytochrome family protein